jgi:hypothetical protein
MHEVGRLDPVEYVHKCYSIEMYKKAYGNIVHPCKDKTEWVRMDGSTILPTEFMLADQQDAEGRLLGS